MQNILSANKNLFSEISLEELAQISGGTNVVFSDKGLFIDGQKIEPDRDKSSTIEFGNLKIKSSQTT